MTISPRIHPFINRDDEGGTPLGFRLTNTSADGVDVAWWKGMDSSGLAIDLTGFTVTAGASDIAGSIGKDPNFVIGFNWSLFAGGMCSLDDEPLWEGTTWWKPQTTRNGLLVQVTGRASYEWLLKVEIIDPGYAIGVHGSLSYRLPNHPIIAGPLLATGSFVG